MTVEVVDGNAELEEASSQEQKRAKEERRMRTSTPHTTLCPTPE